MFVGQTGVGRVIEKTLSIMKEHPDRDVRDFGAIPIDIIQKYINFWSSSSTDLYGAEISSNSANFFRSGLKGRAYEEKQKDHLALEQIYNFENFVDGRISKEEVPLRNAMNEVLRDEYVKDNMRGVDYWNRICERLDSPVRFTLPHRRFNRKIGCYAGAHFHPATGELIDEATWLANVDQWLPTAKDKAYVKSLMKPVYEKGKYASWIAPPAKGIDDKGVDYEYVKLA
jgi:benzoyl-CoA 2,3-dioxygenase component B